MQNPFTTTFSRIPGSTYIPTEQVDEILENFKYDFPSEAVYKITGVRGSGKTVLLGKIENALLSDDFKNEGWLVYRISPTRDMLRQFASLLYKDGFVRNKKSSRSVNISATILGTGAGLGFASTDQEGFFDIGIEIEEMLKIASDAGNKILIGIDEISRTPEMESFASEFGKWLRAGYPVYLVCTGLYENIEQLYNVKNLTFFRRAATVKTGPLNSIRMTEMYRQKLGIDSGTAKELAGMTKGYPYAFQELGLLYFKKSPDDNMEEIVRQLQSELFAYAYEKIWEELSDEDREMIRILSENDENKRDEVLRKMEKPANYSVYRDRLLKRGIISSRRGYISLALPYFKEYLSEYCS